ncbi:DUF559 domain-containing protein [Liquorilactobacillus mali]|uniref:DUF559 domain-containing protein n=1 Tax=Liquorilactobacillus mali TaxID=1618 RepID=UPI0002492EAF|nr:DUF559 domain-containing protein [Liquorilactobacillus mali]
MVAQGATKKANKVGANMNNLGTCWYCGKMVALDEFGDPSERAFHFSCFLKYETERDKTLEEYLRLKSKVSFERALRKIERQSGLNINDYYDDASAVEEFIDENPHKFDSSDEIMAAIELVHERIKSKTQFKIGRRRVDFLIPSLHVALEIDGKLHEFKVVKDSNREIEIMKNLNKQMGGSWEVIRIPTKYIETNIKQLGKAIAALYNSRQSERKKNNGFLPTNWSKTNKIAQINALSNIEDQTKETINLDNIINPVEL